MKTFSKIETLLTEFDRAMLIHDMSVKRMHEVFLTEQQLNTAWAVCDTQERVMRYINNELREYPKNYVDTVRYIISLRKP